MSLKQTIDTDIKKAMLAKNKEELDALRGIKSMILLAETEKGGAAGDLSEDQEAKLLQKAAKQRKESADIFIQQNRSDLADRELKQLEIINRYLPTPFTAAELEAALREIIAETGAKSPQEVGKVMGIASKRLAGKADGKEISELAKKLLS